MLDELFWSKVDRSGGDDACWPYIGARFHFGHGVVRRRGKNLKAHRYADERAAAALARYHAKRA